MKVLISLLLCAVNFHFAHGQSGNWTLFNTSNSGLPSNYVRTIAQESDSIFWIGTSGGVARFDGNNWTVFNTSNSGLPNNEVRAIVIDGHTKWFGTLGGGLAKYNDATWTIYNASNSGLPFDKILCVTMDGDGNLWIGTSTNSPIQTVGGATRFDKINSWLNYNTLNSGIADLNVRTIHAIDTSEIWFGTINGLSKKAGNIWTTYNTGNSPLPYDDVRAIQKDTNNNLWVGTYSGGGPTGGIVKIDGNNWTVYDTSNSSLLANSVGTILIDSCNNIWCGNYYLNKFDGTDWVLFDTINSPLPDYNIAILFEDKSGNIWTGAINNGVAVFKNDCIISSNSTEAIIHDQKVLLSPNPFNQNAILHFTNAQNEPHSLLLYDSEGLLVKSISNIQTEAVTIERQNLPPGLYFFQLQSGKRVKSVGKFIIE